MRSCSDGDNPRNETLVINVNVDVDDDNNDDDNNDVEQAYKRILPKNRLLQEVKSLASKPFLTPFLLHSS